MKTTVQNGSIIESFRNIPDEVTTLSRVLGYIVGTLLLIVILLLSLTTGKYSYELIPLLIAVIMLLIPFSAGPASIRKPYYVVFCVLAGGIIVFLMARALRFDDMKVLVGNVAISGMFLVNVLAKGAVFFGRGKK
jgi:hypothetical protein